MEGILISAIDPEIKLKNRNGDVVATLQNRDVVNLQLCQAFWPDEYFFMYFPEGSTEDEKIFYPVIVYQFDGGNTVKQGFNSKRHRDIFFRALKNRYCVKLLEVNRVLSDDKSFDL